MYLKYLIPAAALIPVLLFLMGLTGFSIVALAAFDNVTINVSVEQVSEITVTPATLNFSQAPGTFSPEVKIDVKNTGSVNVTLMHAYTDTIEDESVRPYGITNSTYYAAGGVLVIRNETLPSRFFAGRLEWNATEDVSNMVKTGVTSPVAWGFYRNSSYEYNWVVGNGTTHLGGGSAVFCNNTGTQIAFDDDIDNGTAASRTPSTASITRDAGNLGYSFFSVNRVGSALQGACVAVSADCGKIYVYAYDKRSGFASCLNSRYLQVEPLQPGETHTVNMSAYLPFGVPATPGQMNTSIFTISVS